MLSIQNVAHTYTQGNESLEILKNCTLTVNPGQVVALVGSSGAGKTTLLQLIGLLEKPQQGDIEVGEKSTKSLTNEARTLLRRHKYGFVYQFHHLLAEFSAIENVVLPQLIAGIKRPQAEEKAKNLLENLGLSHRFSHRPKQLSGGEQQRVAIARALANNPKILLADEPTGNLDPQTASEVFKMLVKLVKDQGRVLNKEGARDNQDERHICPLQLDVIERAVTLWSNPGDLVYSPFAGIGSEGWSSLKLGRRFVGSELKRSYFEQACANLKNAKAQSSLFDMNAALTEPSEASKRKSKTI